jgi:Uma2 family endonuclease
MLTTARPKLKIGLRDHGRKMSLKAFEFAETEEGYHYELSRGIITVSNVANLMHAMVVSMIRDSLGVYKSLHSQQIYLILNSMECKLLVPQWESERHPDIAVYLSKPKGKKDRTVWRSWIPELVIEVVSPRSEHRDYTEKREEYWTLGVKEYWIVDVERKLVVMLRRGKSDWIEKRLDDDGVCTTKLLPGYRLSCRAIFDAVAGIENEEE